MAPKMMRVNKKIAVEMRQRLAVWQSIDTMQTLLDEMDKPHGFYSAGQGAMQFWREAYCACQFAISIGFTEARLCEKDPPDFELRSIDRIVRCELLEIVEPNSRRNEEFNEAAKNFNLGCAAEFKAFDPKMPLYWLSRALENAVKSKSTKLYDRRFILAVFIHVVIFDAEEAESDLIIRNVVTNYLEYFAQIWVLSSDRLFTFSANKRQ